MFENQYLISQNIKAALDNFKNIDFVNFKVSYHNKLSCCLAENENLNLLILGYIIDPLRPEKENADIVNDICTDCNDASSVIRKIQNYSGRYILMVKDKRNFIALTDCCALRQLYYALNGDSLVISSSPKLIFKTLGWAPDIDAERSALMKKRLFIKYESPLLGDSWYDERVKKLLPNHYLNIIDKSVLRAPLFLKKFSSEGEILEYAKSMLKGSLKAIGGRYKIMQPLTSGWDSRVLLAASKDLKENIEYYVFSRSGNYSPADVIVPKKLSEILKINFNIAAPDLLKPEFLDIYKSEHLYPRILPKTRNIQWHYYRNREKCYKYKWQLRRDNTLLLWDKR